MRAATTLAALAAACALTAPAAAGAQGRSYNVSLGYSGRLIIKVLDLNLEQRATAATHSSRARMVSSGVLSRFYRLDTRATSSGPVAAGRPIAGEFTQQNLAGKTRRRTVVEWQGGRVNVQANPAYIDLGDPPASKSQQAAAADPLTQLMRMTLDGSPTTVCRQTYRFFDGKQLYDIRVSNPQPAESSAREQRLGLRDLVSCQAQFSEVAGFKKKTGQARNQGLVRPMRVVFGRAGANGPLVLSSLRSPTPLGNAVIELERLTVRGEDPTD